MRRFAGNALVTVGVLWMVFSGLCTVQLFALIQDAQGFGMVTGTGTVSIGVGYLVFAAGKRLRRGRQE